MRRGWLITVAGVLFLGAASLVLIVSKQPKDPLQIPKQSDNGTASGAGNEPPLFENITPKTGIDFSYRNGEDTADHLSILESLGGGVALIDYDGDGLLDIFLTGGGGFTGADKKQIIGNPCKLYRNLGDWKFDDVTSVSGLNKLAGDTPWFYSHGAAVADYDRDGWPDLLVTGWGRVALFRNIPADPNDPKKGRRFLDVSKEAGLDQGITWATSAGFADLDGDGFPDLYVCQYVDWSWNKNPPCTYDGKTPDVCPPRQFSGLKHKLFLNNTRGGFIDVSDEAGLLPGGPNESKGLGVLIVDVDGDGKPDIYVANDTVNKFLYMNKSEKGKLQFTEAGVISGAAMDDRGGPNGSMGLAAGDPHHTGKPNLWVTNFENELHGLYRNDSTPGKPLFRFRTSAVGIAAMGKNYVGWGTNFLDANLDGWEDLFITNGHAIRFPTGKDISRKQKPVLLMNNSGTFQVSSPLLGAYGQSPHLGRGVGFGDLDNDGRTDLVISHVNEPVAIIRGVGGKNKHWIGVQLQGHQNESTVGAKISFSANGVTQTRFRSGGGSYLSSADQRLLIGLGDATNGSLTVTWPDGLVEKIENPAIDQYHVIKKQNGSKP